MDARDLRDRRDQFLVRFSFFRRRCEADYQSARFDPQQSATL